MRIDVGRVQDKVESMFNGLIAALPNIVVSLIVFTVFLLGAGVMKKFASRMARRYGRTSNIGEIVGRLLQWAIVLTGALVALSVVAPSFQTKDLISTLGIGGLAVGFAFRDIFQNFLAGIILLLTQPFQIGDQIAAGSFEGTIETIETRASTIRTFDGRRVVIPNATLFTETVSVNTAFGKLRSTYEIQLKAVDDIEEVGNELLDAIRGVPDVLRDPGPTVLVSGVDEEKVTLLASWWTPPQHDRAMLIRHRVLAAMQHALARTKPASAMATR